MYYTHHAVHTALPTSTHSTQHAFEGKKRPAATLWPKMQKIWSYWLSWALGKTSLESRLFPPTKHIFERAHSNDSERVCGVPLIVQNGATTAKTVWRIRFTRWIHLILLRFRRRNSRERTADGEPLTVTKCDKPCDIRLLTFEFIDIQDALMCRCKL